ncbi:MAG: TAT-variant-translocated molybdopterin oxidoreductase [Phycisphaerales bacterium]|nr:TAT-variant-translocated molybdopterin oxidoreductase [Phycisphaerales bacterium]
MSTLDHCPSKSGLSSEASSGMSGMKHWRSVEEFSNTPEFREFVEREFPPGASELLTGSRRSFVKLMGASLALAGAATIPGCRRPQRAVMPYSKDVPEEIIPGRPLYYATAIALPGGGAEGLLIETHSGRPTNIEGNPLHPINRGAASVYSIASILDLYDPDRLKFPIYNNPTRGPLPATWDDFKAFAYRHFKDYAERRGEGLAFIVDKKSSPTRNAMRDRVLAMWPSAVWLAWDPAEFRGEVEGTRLALGSPKKVHYNLGDVRAVLSLDSNFADEGPESIVRARAFAATRRVSRGDDQMSRFYAAESSPTSTGSLADHRFRLAPSQISALALAVAHEIMKSQPPSGGAGLKSALAAMEGASVAGVERAHVEAIAHDLINNKGRAVVIAGRSQPPEVHALVWAMNVALGAVRDRDPIAWTTPLDAELASDAGAGMAALTAKMDRGEIQTLVCIGTNPVYDAPAGMGFAEKFAKVKTTICWSVPLKETATAATWALNGAHYLESWGDVEAWDGTISPVQPMIAPLYEPALSDIELLALLMGEQNPDGYTLVTGVWADRLALGRDSAAFDKTWKRALHNGLLESTTRRPEAVSVRMDAVADAVRSFKLGPAPASGSMEVVFATGYVGDGRGANNGWLQELPDPASKVVWGNPAYVSPATARELGLLPIGGEDPYTKQQIPQGRMATLNVGGKRMEIAVWLQPGMADHTVRLVLGYGRTSAGLVGDGVGWNTYAVRAAGAATATGATLEKARGTHPVASTQNHWSMESRTSIVRAIDRKWWAEHAGSVVKRPDTVYGTARSDQGLNLAEQLGELSHTPENVSIYNNPLNASKQDAAAGSAYSRGPQWGMSIDLASCTGCGVCTIACQSENNIPIVGMREVAKGREMHWIRVDRYFAGEDLNNPSHVYMQPVACVHCENAPCETVCPVTATTHDPEGTNNMAYNRCIGTRYCANNCPYKVRRFNFFDYAVAKFKGGLDAQYVGKSLARGSARGIEFNQNLIPPRLRAKVDEITKMQHNPNVTVRSRGVMEKCTYCIQRINRAKQEVKARNIWTSADQVAPIPDGFFKAACQAACPTESIVFGDILDPKSKVSQARASDRSYMLLGYLNTRPRTTYALRVRNPNEKIGVFDHEDPLAHSGGHGNGSHGGNGGHGADHGSQPHGSTFMDRERSMHDRGYAMSLRVLGVQA